MFEECDSEEVELQHLCLFNKPSHNDQSPLESEIEQRSQYLMSLIESACLAPGLSKAKHESLIRQKDLM